MDRSRSGYDTIAIVADGSEIYIHGVTIIWVSVGIPVAYTTGTISLTCHIRE
jgi:hypothetical protein